MKRKLGTVLATCVLAAVMLAGCGGSAVTWTYEEGVSYSDQIAETADGTYDKGLFGLNTTADKRTCADPAILKVEDEGSEYNGMYLLFGTTSAGGFTCYKSLDFYHWAYCAQAFTVNGQSWGIDYVWAPEVIYDEGEGLYYLFYSARNRKMTSVQGWEVMLNVAVSEKPEGPYKEYNEYAAEKAAEEAGKTLTAAERAAALSAPRFDQAKFLEALPEDEMSDIYTAIDPSPFVDPVSGTKYLYMARDRAGSIRHSWIYVVEMEDWATPKYETLTRLTYADDAGYENLNNTINEGPQMTYNAQNGKYYLQFSVNSYGDSTYCVGQAVGDTPTGPFTKLKKEEGGLFIFSGDANTVSGAGHHFMINIEDRMYAVYHRHKNTELGGDIRVPVIDQAVWVKNEDGLEVLHLNGCSTTLQIAATGEYQNIAGEATVNATSGENVSALNDGVIPTHSFETWVKEYEITGSKATVTFEFADYRTVAAIMVYNSLDYDKTFEKIQEIVIEGRYNGKAFKGTIKDLLFNEAYLEYGETVPGAAAIAAFADVEVKRISVTVEKMYEDQECIAIGEIYIVGK